MADGKKTWIFTTFLTQRCTCSMAIEYETVSLKNNSV